MAKLREALDTVNGHLQDMRTDQNQTVRELSRTVEVVGEMQQNVGELQKNVGELQKNVRNLQARSVSLETSTVALAGTFASIDQILTTCWKTALASRNSSSRMNR